MSEETTEPSNVIQLPTEENQPPATDATEIPAAEPAAETPAPEENPVEQAIKGIDLNTITKDDVFTDIINQSKLFAFRLMVGAALLEQLIIKSRSEAETAADTVTPETPSHEQTLSEDQAVS
jgi:hypothetical protein